MKKTLTLLALLAASLSPLPSQAFSGGQLAPEAHIVSEGPIQKYRWQSCRMLYWSNGRSHLKCWNTAPDKPRVVCPPGYASGGGGLSGCLKVNPNVYREANYKANYSYCMRRDGNDPHRFAACMERQGY